MPHSKYFLYQIHRHGDRFPIQSYPNDPHKDYRWPGGFGALSPKGSLQLYNLGKHLRSRYERLLPSDGFYSEDNMRVLSSYAERCIMSVQSLLAGLMPPDEVGNPLPMPWQPVAVNVLKGAEDYVRDIKLDLLTHWPKPPHFHQMLYQLDAPCPKYDAMYNKFLTDPDPQTDFYRYTQQLAGLFKYLSEHSGEVSAIHIVSTWFSS